MSGHTRFGIMLDGSEPPLATLESIIEQAKTVAAFIAQVAKHRPVVPTDELLELSRPCLVTSDFWRSLVRGSRQ